MAKTVKASERDQKAAEAALEDLEYTARHGVLHPDVSVRQLHVALSDLKPLLLKVARPRVGKPIRVH